MGMHQGSSPHDSRGDDGEIEGSGNLDRPDEDIASLLEYISDQLKSVNYIESRMEVDIHTLVEIIAEKESIDKDAGPVFDSLKSYFQSTPQNDTDELQRRLHAAKDRVLEEVQEQIVDETKAEQSQNLLLNILIQSAAFKLAEFEISKDLQYAHRLFIHSHITPFSQAVTGTLEELKALQQKSTLTTDALRRWAQDRIPPLLEEKQAALKMADSWNQGHLLATSIAVSRVLDSFEKNILPPIQLGGPWRVVLGATLTDHYAEGLKSAATEYHSRHKEEIHDTFKRLTDALPPTIRLA
jgi:hypothetical protein